MFTNVSRPSAVDVLRPFAVGDQFYADTISTLAKRAIGSTNDIWTVSGGVPVWSSSIVVVGLTVTDSGFFVVGSADATKRLNFEVDAQTANDTLTINTGAQTDSRTLTVPVLTGNDTLAVRNLNNEFTTAQTVTGAAPQLTLTGASGVEAHQNITAVGAAGATVALSAGAANQCKLTFTFGGVGFMQFGGDASASFFLYDTKNAYQCFDYNQAASTIAFFVFRNTLDATSATDAGVQMRGGLGVSKAIIAGTSIKSVSPTAGIGYATGAGGTVAQGSGSGKATAVTLNAVCGTITMDGANLNADTSVAFTFTNSAIAATDYVAIQHNSVGTLGGYVCVCTPGAGTATVTVRNVTPGNLAEAIVLRFVVIKAVTS